MEIRTQTKDGVLAIELNRPEKKNALTAAMYAAMADALSKAGADENIRAILIHGARQVFTAGNDLAEFRDDPFAGTDAPVVRFLHEISHAQKPIVAAVNGAAVGIGTTMLLHCDLVYAADDAKFSLPFTALGLCPEAASSYLLPLIAGYHRAAELLLLGQFFDAQKAREAGFITQVLPGDDVLPAATRATATLAAMPAKSMRTTKALLKRAHLKQIEDQMDAEFNHFQVLMVEPAATEAFNAFLERRRPDFSKCD